MRSQRGACVSMTSTGDMSVNRGDLSMSFLRMSAAVICVGVVLVLFAGIGCRDGSGRSEKDGPGWIDLVADADESVTQVRFHDDQTFLSVKLTRNNPTVSFGADLNNPIRIVLSGGYSRGRHRPTRDGMIRYRVETGERELVAGEIILEPGSSWWREEVGFPPGCVGTAKITIEVKVRNAHAVLLREARVEQEVRSKKSKAARPQILLISVDTLRQDAVGIFGGPWRTPNLDRLAREGERWNFHYSGAGWTKPSHAVLLTGYRGDTHLMGSNERVLDPALPTIASRFRLGGFTTAAFVYDCHWLDPKFGFDRGFDEYRVSRWRIGRAIYQVSNWVDAHRADSFFLFFHTFEPHSDWRRLPYESPGTTVADVEDVFGVKDYGCCGERCASRRLLDINSGVVPPLPKEAAILRFLYGRGVEETDRALGELFADLKRKGLWDDLLVVVTSDHGEAFYEHGKFLHGSLWNEIIRVPLVIKWPYGRNSGWVEAFVSSSIDIGPTLLEFAGLPLDDLPGFPLQRLDFQRPVSVGGPVRMLVDGDWKMLMGSEIEDVWFLSNTREDPLEQLDLAGEREDILRTLLTHAEKFKQEDDALREKYRSKEAERTATLTDEEKADLEALGYLE